MQANPPTRRAALRALLALAALGLALGAHAKEDDRLIEGVVNLNTASAEQLQVLPGVGEKRAAAILDIRKTRGGFKSVDELTDVKGIGPAMLEVLKPYVTLRGETTARRL